MPKEYKEDEYGIQWDYAHPNARILFSDEDSFFWDCVEESAPFGSDEGDTALSEWRDWRIDNPNGTLKECLEWVITSVGEIKIEDYNPKILKPSLIKKQLNDSDFDAQQYLYTLDISVICTAFGQLVDEGYIQEEAKEWVELAIKRQLIYSKELDWEDYNENLKELLKVLRKVSGSTP